MRNGCRILILSLSFLIHACGGDDTQTTLVANENKALPAPTAAPSSSPAASPSPSATPSPSPTASPSPSPSPTPYAYSGGNGTITTPYLLTLADDVRHIGDNPAAYFSMTQSISFEYEPAMEPLPAFTGILYGHNYELFKIKISSTTAVKTALFVSVAGTIVQLRMTQAVITGSQYASGFAGHLTGMISACAITGTITSPSGGNGYNTGTGTPIYVTIGASATVPGTTMSVQFNGNTVNSIQ